MDDPAEAITNLVNGSSWGSLGGCLVYRIPETAIFEP
jgi:hypothetical protein